MEDNQHDLTWAERADAAVREWHERNAAKMPRRTLRERFHLYRLNRIATTLRIPT